MPLAFGMTQPGQEIEGPMAITVWAGDLLDAAQSCAAGPSAALRRVQARERHAELQAAE